MSDCSSDAPHLVANSIQKYEAVYFGWQAGNGVTGCQHAESWLRSQTAAVKALRPAINTLAYIGNGASVLDFCETSTHKTLRCARVLMLWFLSAVALCFAVSSRRRSASRRPRPCVFRLLPQQTPREWASAAACRSRRLPYCKHHVGQADLCTLQGFWTAKWF